MNDKPPNPKRSVRWWPAGLIMVLAVLAYASLWFIPHVSQQAFNIDAAKVVVGTLLALLLWVMAFSRVRWRSRFAVLGGVAGFLGLSACLFRIHGVSGNLLPILEPRWVRRALPSLPVTATSLPAGAPPPPGAADSPQFFGPDRQGVLAGPDLETNWVATPPKEIWRIPVGSGWSGFSVAGGLAVTQEQRDENECVVAYDLGTGKVVWSHSDPEHFTNPLAGEGPRATPTISSGRVYAQGATGLLNCLDLVSGKVVWSRNVVKENNAKVPGWGDASSPLVTEGLVIVSAGGPKDHSLVAYRVSDGAPVWAGGTQEGTYSSPVLATLGGVRQVVLFAEELTGVDAATGKPLWHFTWPKDHPHVATPIIASDTDVIISSGYGAGSSRVRVSRDAARRWAATQVWKSNRLKAKFTNVILRRGHIYGLDDGVMACLNAETGALEWKEGRYGHGQELLVGDRLLVMAENGDVVLVDPQPDRLRELTRFTALHEKTWNPPALAGEYLLARNDKEAVCFRLPVRR